MPSASPLLNELPIDSVIPGLKQAFVSSLSVVLQAPPGAGKTTRVPLALLDEPWLAGRRIIMLEPRRLAARAAARRMASTLGEPVGETVGYRMRMDTKVSKNTRIEVVTDGVFVRQLQHDPALDGVGVVIFDEVHERGLDSDLNLALCLEVQGALRADLRLLAMSATLDGAAVARLLGDAPVLSSEGRSFPVETVHLERPAPKAVEDAVAAAVRRALAEADGDILVFLPGAAEIRRVQARLDDVRDVIVAPLFGELSQADQDIALEPDRGGRRRVVLATAIAETSLTIEGVSIVIDSGLMRLPRFDPRTGMSGLETVRVSQASADQRRGRAGRLGPGRCYRLWPEAEQRGLVPFTPPEILAADLTPLVLDLALWGAEPGQLAWLDAPPSAAYEQAQATLRALGGLGDDGRITAHGRDMTRFGVHPRLAHMMLAGKARGAGRLAGALAAILSERDVVRARPGARDADLRLRVELLTAPARERGHLPAGARQRDQLPEGVSVDRGSLERARQSARSWQRQLGTGDETVTVEDTGALVALAYPDRVAQRRGGRADGGQFVLANGRGARLAATDPLAAADFLAVADLDAGRQDAEIFRAAPLTLADIEDVFADQITSGERVEWNAREGAVLARRQRRFGRLVLKDEPLQRPSQEAVAAALLEGVRAAGLSALPWTKELEQWRARVAFVRTLDLQPGDWPDLSDAALTVDLDWLLPFLDGMTRLTQLKNLDLASALRARLDWQRQKRLDAAAPTHVGVPSGSRLPIDYAGGEAPVLAVRLQEMFGLADTPTVADGRVKLLLHLLSPASRPVQVTRDLASFWATGYRAVKADLKGQYPRHYWPDDPLQAQPTNRTKKRMGL